MANRPIKILVSLNENNLQELTEIVNYVRTNTCFNTTSRSTCITSMIKFLKAIIDNKEISVYDNMIALLLASKVSPEKLIETFGKRRFIIDKDNNKFIL